jgi:hypothetical protein
MLLLKSDKENIKLHVASIKRALRLDSVRVIDAMTVIRKIKEIYPEFNYLRKLDSEMDGRSAYFEPGPYKNTVVLSESVFRGMNSGNLNCIKILLEEIGHFYLGHKFLRNHNAKRAGYEDHSNIKKDELEAGYFVECWVEDCI